MSKKRQKFVPVRFLSADSKRFALKALGLHTLELDLSFMRSVFRMWSPLMASVWCADSRLALKKLQ